MAYIDKIKVGGVDYDIQDSNLKNALNTTLFAEDCPWIKELFINSAGAADGLVTVNNIQTYSSKTTFRLRFANSDGSAFKGDTGVFSISDKPYEIIPIYKYNDTSVIYGYIIADFSWVTDNTGIGKAIDVKAYHVDFSPRIYSYLKNIEIDSDIADLQTGLNTVESTVFYVEDCPWIRELYINSIGKQAGLATVNNAVVSNGTIRIRFANSTGTAFVGTTEWYSMSSLPNDVITIKDDNGETVYGYAIIDFSVFTANAPIQKALLPKAYCLDYAPSIKTQISSGRLNKIRTVGSGQEYPTITSAISASSDGDVILIFPGTYHEAIARTAKVLNIIGVSRDDCIIEYGNGDYADPPLEMAKGVLKNLTIHATQQEVQNETYGKAYAFHIDFQSSGVIGGSFYAENVKFINDDYRAVGMGLRGNAHIEFVNCEFVSLSAYEALYCHDANKTSYDISNQSAAFINCTFRNNSNDAHTIEMVSQERQSKVATITWQRNIVANAGTGGTLAMSIYPSSTLIDGNGWMGSSDWVLSNVSALNTNTDMNY